MLRRLLAGDGVELFADVAGPADEGEGVAKADFWYGGMGYGKTTRADGRRADIISLEYTLQALKDSDLPANDAAWQKAITFLQRTQNNSEVNDQKWAANDGGFAYYQIGWEPDWAPLRLGTVVISEAVRACAEQGLHTFDFLRGTEPYKYRFGAVDHYDDTRLLPRGPSGALLALKHRVKDRRSEAP